MVKIRLRRTGRKKQPTFRIVVADSQSPRDGKFIEVVGQYNPRQGENALNLKSERVNYWLDSGAQPTDTVRSLLRRAGVLKARHEQRLAKSSLPAPFRSPSRNCHPPGAARALAVILWARYAPGGSTFVVAWLIGEQAPRYSQ